LAETKSELTFDIDAPRVSRISGEYVRDFFKQGIRYLGPLRDAPRPVYPLEALESTTEVGYRGEHTAAVFQLNSHTHVSLHMPPGEHFDSDYITEARRVRLSLHDATISWLSVFGNRLQVATDSIDRWHDLTNVGVGVSQVLPLVVTALLARPGSLLIFEQPELHLHPRVQARLADFFLALALDGKQMLLETHSEYLIDRFRLRVALSESDAVRPLMSILFTEKHRGQSHITPVEVTEFGAIANWPKDFFDQSQKDVARLLKAASKRRARGVQLR
jgi:predicted ATPase